MAEPIIHVMPEAYWGGREPKPQPKEEAPATSFAVERPKAKTLSGKLRGRTIFLISAGIVFLAVIGSATWYFTRPLRQVRPTPAAETAPQPPASETPPIPPAASQPAIPDFPEPAVPPAEAPQPPPPTAPTQDTDNDGLTDVEEEMYRSNLTIPDTDNDGFLDGHEVFHLYNPAGTAPQRLEDTEFTLRHRNEQFGYTVLFPAFWRIVPKEEQGRTLLFAPAVGDPITIVAVENLERLTLIGWLRQQEPQAVRTSWTTNKSGLEGYVGSDGLTFYFAGDDRIYIIRYEAEVGRGPYKRTAEMMANSFTIL